MNTFILYLWGIFLVGLPAALLSLYIYGMENKYVTSKWRKVLHLIRCFLFPVSWQKYFMIFPRHNSAVMYQYAPMYPIVGDPGYFDSKGVAFYFAINMLLWPLRIGWIVILHTLIFLTSLFPKHTQAAVKH